MLSIILLWARSAKTRANFHRSFGCCLRNKTTPPQHSTSIKQNKIAKGPPSDRAEKYPLYDSEMHFQLIRTLAEPSSYFKTIQNPAPTDYEKYPAPKQGKGFTMRPKTAHTRNCTDWSTTQISSRIKNWLKCLGPPTTIPAWKMQGNSNYPSLGPSRVEERGSWSDRKGFLARVRKSLGRLVARTIQLLTQKDQSQEQLSRDHGEDCPVKLDREGIISRRSGPWSRRLQLALLIRSLPETPVEEGDDN